MTTTAVVVHMLIENDNGPERTDLIIGIIIYIHL